MGRIKKPDNFTVNQKKEDGERTNNEKITAMLMELSVYEKNITRNHHKANIYRKAAQNVTRLEKQIINGDEAQKTIEGIGKKIGKKIDELLTTGKLKKLEEIEENSDMKAIQLMSKINGIGPVLAHTLVLEKNIKTITVLKQHESLLNHSQLIGLKYFDEIQIPIPREEMKKHYEFLKNKISGKELIMEIVGSYRRGCPSSGDIDVLLTHPKYFSTNSGKTKDLEILIESLSSVDYIIETISCGKMKFMGICQLPSNSNETSSKKRNHNNSDKNDNGKGEMDSEVKKTKRNPIKERKSEMKEHRKKKLNENIFRRLDVTFTPIDHYYCAILHATGSDEFNRRLRQHALDNGYRLNEKTLRKFRVDEKSKEMIFDEPIPIKSEEDIFRIIGYKYHSPSERG
ncbi:hypothetical protein SNEBB_003855 [Seison nebaliae]|nr:hypothetical protein SNEBB_003855 [Seison nebaliae]